MPNFEEVLKCGVACSFKFVGSFVKSPGIYYLASIFIKRNIITSKYLLLENLEISIIRIIKFCIFFLLKILHQTYLWLEILHQTYLW